MTWKTADAMTLRTEFLRFAQQQSCSFSDLCKRFNISRKTGYKWLERAKLQSENLGGQLQDRSRKPRSSPTETPADMQQQIVKLRELFPTWGGRKIHHRLLNLGHRKPPAPSTISDILRRHQLISPVASQAATAWQRFEHDQPNSLWQIDFKGYFETIAERCYPLTLLDDHSRFNLTLTACAKPSHEAVKTALTGVFQQYGLPARINADNGPPWGSPSSTGHGLTQLTVWLIRLGITVSHSRPYHPQTNGKDERFHRTLNADVIQRQVFKNNVQAQKAFDDWRSIYNELRPHEALQFAVPISRYSPSLRCLPESLEPIEYFDTDEVVRVGWNGLCKFKGHEFKVSNALQSLPIALRLKPQGEQIYELFFCHQYFGSLDLLTSTVTR